MSRFLALTLMLFATTASAQEAIGQPKQPTGKLVYETWMAASFDGVRAGYVYDSVVEMDSGNQKVLRASRKLVLSVKRFGDMAVVEAITGTDETPDGKVVGTFMKQQISKNNATTVRGIVVGNQLQTTAQGQMNFSKNITWDPNVVGTWGELQLVGKLKPAPGTAFEYLMYEPTVNALVKVQANAVGYEQVNVGNEKFNLLKVTAQPQPLAGIRLPGSTFWYDAKYAMVKSETIMPGLGHLVLLRTNQADATRPCEGPDLGWRQSITLTQPLKSPFDDALITYRIKLTNAGPNPEELFARDDRQSVKVVGEGALELTVKGKQEATAPGNTSAKDPGNEFTESNFFLTSDNALIKQHAAAAIGAETDPWKKALLIERWVHQNMRAMNFTEAMAPASEVARTMTGDCTEFSMLTAAMCRVAGVPSRTALGLVYVDARENRPPMLAMHMWSEVWVGGQWVGLDSTIGRGSIGPGHIKITDHSWHRIATMTPLLPLMKLNMASPTVEIVNEQRSTP